MRNQSGGETHIADWNMIRSQSYAYDHGNYFDLLYFDIELTGEFLMTRMSLLWRFKGFFYVYTIKI